MNEVVNGALANSLSSIAQIIVTSISGLRSRRYAADIAVAQWFDMKPISKDGPPLPRLPEATRLHLAKVLKGEEAQAVLQELLAARLTAAPLVDITNIRKTWKLTFANSRIENDQLATTIFDYYDERIGALVARLAKADPSPLDSIRERAFSARLVAILSAIERHTASLVVQPDRASEQNFLDRYRGQVRDLHGKIEPPDFDRRRRVPLENIYVDTTIYEQESPQVQEKLSLSQLAHQLDRTVLLGDPGSGKTTAAKALMNFYAADESRRIPFLVTLRDYAATAQPEGSIISYIERELGALYQCPPPPGLVDRLFLTGRAVVVFDGLDELLDNSRRIDVTTRVERFSYEYPLSSVLVTSRIVGYEEARLDVTQFTCYRISEFTDLQVGEYAHKWFALQEDAAPEEAAAFLSESASVQDLRSNPLLLSLMCILYRGEGSLPHDRSGIYRSCAELLFRKWDERRRIHRELRASHLVEPAIRYLAWWLFTRGNTQSAVSEGELVAETSRFLHGRGFESLDDARDAAGEFVDFCRGRMWVLSDIGTNRKGQSLYSFTHRTFLEYFTAVWLASTCDTPEALAGSLAEHLSSKRWDVVSELAIQIKESTTDQGADRVYKALLKEPMNQGGVSELSRAREGVSATSRDALIAFLIRCLRSVVPSPAVVRSMTTELLDDFTRGDARGGKLLQLSELLTSSADNRNVVADEIGNRIHQLLEEDSSVARNSALRLAMVPGNEIVFKYRSSADPVLRRQIRFWANWLSSYADDLDAAFEAEAPTNNWLWIAALMSGIVSIESVLDNPDGMTRLMVERPWQARIGERSAYLPYIYYELFESALAEDRGIGVLMAAENHGFHNKMARMHASALGDFSAVGRYITEHPHPPWIRRSPGGYAPCNIQMLPDLASPDLDEMAYLGIAAFVCSVFEIEGLTWLLPTRDSDTGPLHSLLFYIDRRRRVTSSRHFPRRATRAGLDGVMNLPELPVPPSAKDLMHDWANAVVSFTDLASPPEGD